MSKNTSSTVLFEEIDTNQDGYIDKEEFKKWASNKNAEGSSGVTYETTTTEYYDGAPNRSGRSKYSSYYGTVGANDQRYYSSSGAQSVTDHTYISSSGILAAGGAQRYATTSGFQTVGGQRYSSSGSLAVSGQKYTGTYGTLAVDSQYVSGTVIETNSLEETDRYLAKAVDIYKDPSPQIIHRGALDTNSITYEQRVFVRYLQPPKLPPPGPLIVKQIRPAPPPPAPPLIIRQYQSRPPTPPPIVLRERPPTPPAALASETVTRYLPAPPPLPRSVIIERYPSLPEKPRDIIIERWVPYGVHGERRTIIEEETESYQGVQYEARNKIIIYDGVDPRIHRQFEKGGITLEDPADYVARYGSSLLESHTLLELARKYGVYEDLTPPAYAAIASYSTRREGSNYDYASTVRNTKYLTDNTYRRRGVFFDFSQYGLLPGDYVPGMRLTRKFVRPTNFVFPASSLWSTRVAKYRETVTDGQTSIVTVELAEDGVTIYSRSFSESEYNRASVTSSAPKLAWTDFIQVLKVFMLGNSQQGDSDIANAFDILDQGKRGVFGRTVNLADGLISPDELRAFLSILTDEYRVDLCVFLADTDGSGQISLSEFTRMVKSGLARDVICERT